MIKEEIQALFNKSGDIADFFGVKQPSVCTWGDEPPKATVASFHYFKLICSSTGLTLNEGVKLYKFKGGNLVLRNKQKVLSAAFQEA